MKEILFRPISTDVEKFVDKPKPAKNYFPEWYKKVPKFHGGKLEITDSAQANVTMKSCMPFFDSFTVGYIQETWCDIYIEDAGDELKWRYSTNPTIIEQRSGSQYDPTIEGFHPLGLSWRQSWIPKLPKGYSMIYTHPFNRFDLPFISLTGIVDNDRFYMERIANHPFFVRKGFTGTIPRGTPMFQMIPIKRDAWKSYFGKYSEDLVYKFAEVQKYFYDGYKKLYWQKKEYN